MTMQPDLIVVGGGPAGTAAAITANRLGARLLLLEQGRFPRHKVCGEFISPESVGVLKSLLGEAAFEQLTRDAPRISQTRIYFDGAVLRGAIDPPALSVSRHALDLALWENAQRDGIDCREQVRVVQVERQADGIFELSAEGNRFRGSCLIDATGRVSKLRPDERLAEGTNRSWLGIKAHFATDEKLGSSVDLYFFEGGYCGVQPVASGVVNACAMVGASWVRDEHGAAAIMSRVLRLHPALAARSRTWKEAMEPVATFPLFFRTPLATQDGIVRAGDAAAFIDPFVGDGISLALRTGVLAAECLSEVWLGRASLEGAAQTYSAAYKRMYVPVLRSSTRLRRVLTLPQVLRKPLLHAAQLAGLGAYLVRSTRAAQV